jgi:hypothetical protein
VEEDLVVGTVPLDLLESCDESLEEFSVLKLALERRRRSLKNGIWLKTVIEDGGYWSKERQSSVQW